MRSAVATCSKTVSLPIDLDSVAAAPQFDALTSMAGTDILFHASCDEPIQFAALSIWRADGMPHEFSQQSLDLVAGLELLGITTQNFLDRELSQ